MDRNFARALPKVLKHEGGFVNHPKDPGGATNKGVTLASFRAFVKPGGTVEDLKRITDEQVATVYYRNYWAAVQAHNLPSGVDYAVFDFAVNSGPRRAAQFLQRVLGVPADGRVGPKTIAAAQSADSRAVINKLCDARMAFLQRLKIWPTFKKGWTRRVADVRKDALAIVGDPADLQIVPVEVEIEVQKPIVPVEVDEAVKKNTGIWQWLVTIFGGGGLGLGAIFGADWQAILSIGGVLLAFLVVILVMRRQISATVKDIRSAVER